MSQEQVLKFAQQVKNDRKMFEHLMVGSKTPADFIDKAVALGAKNGYKFTREEADGWIKKEIEAKANGELSDMQLESVAGGKGPGPSDQKIIDAANVIVYEIGEQFKDLGKDIKNWFSSW